jgi:hypothetical protein
MATQAQLNKMGQVILDFEARRRFEWTVGDLSFAGW